MIFLFFLKVVIQTFALPAAAVVVVLSLIVAGIAGIFGGNALHAFLWTAAISSLIAIIAAIVKAFNPGSFA
ncbi:MAG TPA: hypothetical protein V6C81_02845 [Planktothrix sp.]|jgi:hypothetical protein